MSRGYDLISPVTHHMDIWSRKGKALNVHTTNPGVLQFPMSTTQITRASSLVKLSVGHSLQMPSKWSPSLIKNFGVAGFGRLTCRPPFFGLCWAPLLDPALQAHLEPVGALGPDA